MRGVFKQHVSKGCHGYIIISENLDIYFQEKSSQSTSLLGGHCITGSLFRLTVEDDKNHHQVIPQ